VLQAADIHILEHGFQLAAADAAGLLGVDERLKMRGLVLEREALYAPYDLVNWRLHAALLACSSSNLARSISHSITTCFAVVLL
jgi:hypothetical protein